jgi:hypothetical protein
MKVGEHELYKNKRKEKSKGQSVSSVVRLIIPDLQEARITNAVTNMGLAHRDLYLV